MQTEALARVMEKLDKLARLGNEPEYGNSVGNVIAQQAIADLQAVMGAALGSWSMNLLPTGDYHWDAEKGTLIKQTVTVMPECTITAAKPPVDLLGALRYAVHLMEDEISTDDRHSSVCMRQWLEHAKPLIEQAEKGSEE